MFGNSVFSPKDLLHIHCPSVWNSEIRSVLRTTETVEVADAQVRLLNKNAGRFLNLEKDIVMISSDVMAKFSLI